MPSSDGRTTVLSVSPILGKLSCLHVSFDVLGTILGYVFYWIAVIITLFVMKRRGASFALLCSRPEFQQLRLRRIQGQSAGLRGLDYINYVYGSTLRDFPLHPLRHLCSRNEVNMQYPRSISASALCHIALLLCP